MPLETMTAKEEKKTTKDTEKEKENKRPKTLLDDLLAGIYDHNKRYNLTKR